MRPAVASHNLILWKKYFTVKNIGNLSFLSGKYRRETGMERKTIYAMASETITAGLKSYAI